MDFKALRRGKKFVCGPLRFTYAANGLPYARLGLAVPRQYGNAVHRNRLKRMIREGFRTSCIINMGVDVLVAPVTDRQNAVNTAADIQRGLEKIAKQLSEAEA